MSELPHHIAFIMDGNGRWATRQGLSRSAGHKAGFEHIPDVLDACYQLGIPVVSAYAWSTENWDRPEPEVQFIVEALENELPRFVNELDKRGARFWCSGNLDAISPRARQVISAGIDQTRANGPCIFNLAFNYGGRAEITHVAQVLAAQAVQTSPVDTEAIRRHLWTGDLPDVDLVFRTGGDRRLSNFLLWQSAYANVYVTDTFWPDLTINEIRAGLNYDQARQLK